MLKIGNQAKMNTPYFSNIEQIIIGELSKSKWTISVAVAWFTNKNIYDVLLEKAAIGLDVSLILNKDDINCGTNSLDFSELIRNGVTVRWNEKWRESLMHEKFCIIDGLTVIEGTYNWTYKAENNNMEHIVLIKEDDTLINMFMSRFEQLCDEIPAVQNEMNTEWLEKNKQIRESHIYYFIGKQKKEEERKKRKLQRSSQEWLAYYSRPWTDDEEALLLHYYYKENLSVKIMATILKRTNAELERRLKELEPIAKAMNLKK